MTPHYADEFLEVWLGDCREALAAMPAESVQTVITSPPYWGLRDYGVSGQIGLELDPAEYVAQLVEVFREVRRVLRRDGTLWLNLGDTYASKSWGTDAGWDKSRLTNPGYSQKAQAASMRRTGERHRGKSAGLKAKDRAMIPARVAIALQADGWWLRDEVVWHKPNPMPSSVEDRTTPAHEMVYLLSRSPRYYYDAASIREDRSPTELAREARGYRLVDSVQHDPAARPPGTSEQRGLHRASWPGGKQGADDRPRSEAGRTYAGFNDRWDAGEAERLGPTWDERKAAGAGAGSHGALDLEGTGSQRVVHGRGLSHDLGRAGGRNRRSVWTVATEPYPEAHFATFPERLVEPMVLAGCPAGGVVLDPFGGSGTVGVVAQRLGRRAVLIDLSAEYVGQMIRRIAAARAAGAGPAIDMPVPFASDGLWAEVG